MLQRLEKGLARSLATSSSAAAEKGGQTSIMKTIPEMV
jgi:hypothetical protein